MILAVISYVMVAMNEKLQSEEDKKASGRHRRDRPTNKSDVKRRHRASGKRKTAK